MKTVTLRSTCLIGLEPFPVTITVVSEGPRRSGGFNRLSIAGLTDVAAREARIRIASALVQAGVDLTEQVDVTVSPEVASGSSALDLPIAVGVLALLGHVPRAPLDGELILGELSLQGNVRPIRGVLAHLRGARELDFEWAIVPSENGAEAHVQDVDVCVASDLASVVGFLRGSRPLSAARSAVQCEPDRNGFDLADIVGLPEARRALEIAAAGEHGLLLIGPPGAGKTMLARRLTTILPGFTGEEQLDVSAIHSVAGLISPNCGLVASRPFRAPHHTVSEAGLVGGGTPVRPGEVSLAHRGVLFLDEVTEFRRAALDALAHVLNTGAAEFLRQPSWYRTLFPARPLLVAAANGCACGYAGDASGRCKCTPESVQRHRAWLTGRLFDRIDLRVTVPPVAVSSLKSPTRGESSDVVQARVTLARALLAAHPRAPRTFLSKVTRVARTIAALDGTIDVRPKHVEEATALIGHETRER